MRILLVAATTFEIKPLIGKLELAGQQNELFSRYKYKNTVLDVLIPGVGMVATAFYLGKQLASEHYDFAINAGIAGTFNKSLVPGSVVNVTEDCIPELGAEDGEHFLSIFELGLSDLDTPPFQNGRLINNSPEAVTFINMEYVRKLPVAKGITSNTIRGSVAGIARIQNLAKADLESMEGAAFFYACMVERVPCLQVRSVSNFVEERDTSKWELSVAIENLNLWLLGLLIDIC